MIERIEPRDRDMYSRTDEQIHYFYQQAIADAIKVLLEKKHLYQSVLVNHSPLIIEIQKAKLQINEHRVLVSSAGEVLDRKDIAKAEAGCRAQFVKVAESMALGRWILRSESVPDLTRRLTAPAGHPDNTFNLPGVKVVCWKCKERLPHNSGHTGMHTDPAPYVLNNRAGTVQLFSLAYQCQACKEEPIVFLIRREGLTLTLVGRSHLEAPEIPVFIPKEIREYYGQAIIARNCNYVLAGIFYLRVVVEKWMRLKTGETAKRTGDELGDLYATTLPKGFSDYFPSFKKTYENLSVALHAAHEDEDLFAKELANIESHFDALRVHATRKIGDPSTSSG